MSCCIRPVVETWGEPMTFLSRTTDIADLIVRIAHQRDTCSAETYQYGSDVRVAWVDEGAQFLDFLASTTPEAILAKLANDGYTSSQDEEYEREAEDVREICRMVPQWRNSIDTDGSLRFYCD
jgi:hypothetical protein